MRIVIYIWVKNMREGNGFEARREKRELIIVVKPLKI